MHNSRIILLVCDYRYRLGQTRESAAAGGHPCSARRTLRDSHEHQLPTRIPASTTSAAATSAAKKLAATHKILTALGAAFGLLIAIIIISAAAGGGSTPSGTPAASAPATTPSTAPANAPPKTAGIGTPVRDGKFQFTVTKVTHAKTVGSSALGQTAHSKYTVLHVTVKNIGSEAQTLDDSSQYVFDSAGRKFSADSQADLYINGTGDSVFLQQINPGNSVHGLIAFDLPTNDKAVKAELHDSAFSGGVTLSLTH